GCSKYLRNTTHWATSRTTPVRPHSQSSLSRHVIRLRDRQGRSENSPVGKGQPAAPDEMGCPVGGHQLGAPDRVICVGSTPPPDQSTPSPISNNRTRGCRMSSFRT